MNGSLGSFSASEQDDISDAVAQEISRRFNFLISIYDFSVVLRSDFVTRNEESIQVQILFKKNVSLEVVSANDISLDIDNNPFEVIVNGMEFSSASQASTLPPFSGAFDDDDNDDAMLAALIVLAIILALILVLFVVLRARAAREKRPDSLTTPAPPSKTGPPPSATETNPDYLDISGKPSSPPDSPVKTNSHYYPPNNV